MTRLLMYHGLSKTTERIIGPRRSLRYEFEKLCRDRVLDLKTRKPLNGLH